MMAEQPAPAPPGRCAITTWPNLPSTDGTAIETTWEEFFASLDHAPRFAGDMHHPGWSAAIFEPVVRAKQNVVGLSALVLDYDGGSRIEDAAAHWAEWFGVIHTTRKHKPDAHRFRVILPLTRIVTAEEYEILWRWAESIAAAAGHTIDPATKDASRFWFMPGPQRGGTYELHRLHGHAVDPDPIIASHRYAENERQREIEDPTPERRTRGYGNRALEIACDRIRRAAKGQRNDTLNKEAYSIARLVGGGVIDDAVARRDLRAAGLAAGLEPGEVTKTLGSAFSSGLQNPRKAPALRPVDRGPASIPASTGTDGPAPQSAPEQRPAGHVFKRGDHVELAEVTLARLETSPMTFDDGEFWRYEPDSGLWKKIAGEFVEHTAGSFAGSWIEVGEKWKPLLISHSACRGAATIARNTLCSRPGRRKFDTATPGIAFRDRFVTVSDGEIKHHAHAPDHLARHGLPFDWDPLAHPEMDKFFADLFEGCDDAADRIKLLQEFIGACLLGMAPSYQRCLVLYGTGNNGKSQVLDIARAAFPDGTVVSLPPQQWDERFRLPLLVGALANFVGELPSREVASSETFKGIVTGDPQTAERKNRDAFTFSPRAGNLFGSNSLPTAGDISAGFFRRFLILPLTKVFPESGEGVERDIGKRIAREERQAIAAWAVEGAARLQRQGGYTVPASVAALKEQWTRDSDSVLLFLETRTANIQKEPNAGLKHTELYEAYVRWAKSLGFVPVNAINFSRRYTASGRTSATISGKARYYVRLLQEHEL